MHFGQGIFLFTLLAPGAEFWQREKDTPRVGDATHCWVCLYHPLGCIYMPLAPPAMHLYRRIFIHPFRLFLDIVYGDLCIAFFISELSGQVIKEKHRYISPGECLCPFNKKIWMQHNRYRLSEYRRDNCAFTCDK